MPRATRPRLPLPVPMTGVNRNTWAFDTITRRWPDILNRIFHENDLPPKIVANLEAVGADIPDAPIRSIDDPGTPYIGEWNNYILEHEGKNWLEAPWFFSEHYFYRRVMAAIGYFQPGEGRGLDPFAFQKRQGLSVGTPKIEELAEHVAKWVQSPPSTERLSRLFHMDLWGNQADLSLWPAEGEEKPDHNELDAAKAYLLVDDTAAAATHLSDLGGTDTRVDILVDNAGVELFSDLVLSDYLLSKEIAAEVRLHLKPHPTYVSDAMIQDVRETIEFLEKSRHKYVKALGHRLESHVTNQRLGLNHHYFWTSPLPAWKMPATLMSELSTANLVISKGDAHYRRLLGDLDWPCTTTFSDIVAYFPAPLLALRTLKSELACGLDASRVETVTKSDRHWLTNGRWGTAQFTC